MKTRIGFGLLICLTLITALLGTAGSASAQKGAIAKIPFAFEANHRMLPAGDYKIIVLAPHLIELMDRTAGTHKTFLLVHPESENSIETRGRLIFFHHDRRYYLKQVRFSGYSIHADLIVPASLQREIARDTRPAESTVEIAMK